MRSRRLIIALATALTLALATPAFAQQRQVNSGLGIGALAGLTWTSLSTEMNQFNIDTSSDTGVMFGIWFGGNRDGRAGLMGEFSYVTKKIKFNEPGFGEFTQKLTYIEIPVLLRINTGARERDKPSLYFLIGPNFDIQIKNELDGDSVDDFYEGLDIGLMGGVGFEVVRIGIEVRYNWGLRSVLGTDAAVDAGFGSTKQNTLQLIGKIRFN
jgi:hypothetical protein